MSWDNLENIKWGDNVVEFNSNISEKLIDDKAIKRNAKSLDIHTIKARQLSDLCGQPKKGEQWRIITEKQFNAFNLILDVIQGRMIEELYIAIYRINEATVNTIKELITGGTYPKSDIRNLKLLLADQEARKMGAGFKTFLQRESRDMLARVRS